MTWPKTEEARWKKMAAMVKEWPDYGIRVGVVLSDPKKTPIGWSRASLDLGEHRIVVLALVREADVTVTKTGFACRPAYKTAHGTVTEPVEVHWGFVTSAEVTTEEEYDSDRQVTAARKKSLPAVRTLLGLADKTDLLSPDELAGNKS